MLVKTATDTFHKLLDLWSLVWAKSA